MLDMDSDISVETRWLLRKNEVETEDDFVNLGQLSHSFVYYDIERRVDRPRWKATNEKLKHNLFNNMFLLSDMRNYHERRVYNYFDLLGEIGGIIQILLVTSSFFIIPISQF